MSTKKPLILIIDDNVTNIKVAREHLRQNSFEVMVAQNGTRGLERAKHSQPDLIVLDVMMPGIDGFETCRRLKADPETEAIPVIFMTVSSDTIDKVEGFAVGGVDYVTKPVEPLELLARINSHLTIAQLQQALTTRNQQLEQQIAERQRIEAHLLEQQRFVGMMEERERLAEDLHDNLAQQLAYFNLQAQAVIQQLNQQQVASAQDRLADLVAQTQTMQHDLRHYILGLDKRLASSEEGLLVALDSYLTQFSHLHGLTIQFNKPATLAEPPLPPPVVRQLLRVVREAMTNILKHASARSVQVILTELDSHLQLLIIDDGQGFETTELTATTEPTHFGLLMMEERVAQLGGQLQIRSQLGQGTTLTIYLPRQQTDQPLTGLRILLVDDHPLFLTGLQNLLLTRGLEVVGQAHSGLQALTMARELQPDIVLMDLHMPEQDGLETTRQLKAEFPDLKILILTMSAVDNDLVTALKHGADGYLLKTTTADQLFAAISALQAGETALTPKLTSKLASQLTDPTRHSPLTDRQTEILGLMAQGQTYKEIAQQLTVSENTVKYHVKQILNLLDVKNRASAVALAKTEGWV